MFFRVLVALVILFVGYGVFQIYGYRYVLSDIRGKADVDMVMGSLDATTNIVAYVDYGSPSTRQLHATFVNLLSAYPDVNILLRPVEGSSEISKLAVRLAYAAEQDGKFLEYHNMMMAITMGTELTENLLKIIVRSLDLDYDQLKAVALSEEVDEKISQLNMELLLMNVETLPRYYIEHVKIDGGGESLTDIIAIIKDIKVGRL